MKLVALLSIILTSCGASVSGDHSIQDRIDRSCSRQETFHLPKGRTYIYAPIKLTTNCKIVGDGPDFGTVIHPIGVSAFIIDGDFVSGGWSFRNRLSGFTIDGGDTSKTLIVINKTYSTQIDRVFIFNQTSDIGLKINNSNHIQVDKVVMYGKSKVNKIGILISGNSSAMLTDIDIENYARCIKTKDTSTTTITSPYMERCIVNIEHATSRFGSTTVLGGILRSNNGYNIGLMGNNFNLYGTKLQSYIGDSLSGKVAHCFNANYINVNTNGLTPYPGYLVDTNCNGILR